MSDDEERGGTVRTLDLGASAGDANLDRGSITFVGTATVILQWGGLAILTDPNFLHKGDHVHLGFGMTSERLLDPAIRFEDLPAIDLVLLSHLHEDHFDRLVERELSKSMPIVTTPHAATKLANKGFTRVEALATWASIVARKGNARARITAMPGKHAPGPLQLLIPPTMGSLVELDAGAGAKPYRVYVTGDTLLFDDLREIPARYPEIDLMLIHLGGTRILGVLLTMNAEQGIEVVKIVAPETTIPIHYGDYDVFREPIGEFWKRVAAANLLGRVRSLGRGESYAFEVGALARTSQRGSL